MSKKIFLAAFVLSLAACDVEQPSVATIPEAATAAPQTLIHNARIYSMDAGFSTASAMAFDSTGKIHNLGDEQAMLAAFPDAEHIDLGGKTVIPGLID